MMLANRAAIVPLIPKVLADLPAQREAAAHRDACAACVRDYHMVRLRAGSCGARVESSRSSFMTSKVSAVCHVSQSSSAQYSPNVSAWRYRLLCEAQSACRSSTVACSACHIRHMHRIIVSPPPAEPAGGEALLQAGEAGAAAPGAGRRGGGQRLPASALRPGCAPCSGLWATLAAAGARLYDIWHQILGRSWQSCVCEC